MTKTIFLGIAMTAAFMAGLLLLMPAQQAITQLFDVTERDNTTITKIKLEKGQRMILVDNAGIGGTSDVEVTWRFDTTECMIQTSIDNGATFQPLVNDGVFGIAPPNPAHGDVPMVDVVLMTTQPNKDCELDPGKGEFVTVSTVGST